MSATPPSIARQRAACALAFMAAMVAAGGARCAQPRVLRVCADPANLPFTDREEGGFENRIAELVARDLGAKIEYTWWAQRRGFARNTLGAGQCDLWPGVASDVSTMTTTKPYYRSSYVFVSRRADGLDIATFDDARLRTLKVGVQMIGNDATNTPPAHALARRGIAQNVRGYMVYGVDHGDSARSPIVDAVADGDIDVAVVWGPVAGYFAQRSRVPLRLAQTPVRDGEWPMAFDISMGVRKGDAHLKDEIESALDRDRNAVDAILDRYEVPRASPAVTAPAKAAR